MTSLRQWRGRQAAVLIGLVIALGAAFLLSLVLGSTWVPVVRVVEVLLGASRERDAAAVVIEVIRLPRSLTAVLTGASLGVAGLQMQTLFRNPLADPFALGISAGASLGVALVVLGAGFGAASVLAVRWAFAETRWSRWPRWPARQSSSGLSWPCPTESPTRPPC